MFGQWVLGDGVHSESARGPATIIEVAIGLAVHGYDGHTPAPDPPASVDLCAGTKLSEAVATVDVALSGAHGIHLDPIADVVFGPPITRRELDTTQEGDYLSVSGGEEMSGSRLSLASVECQS